MVDGLINLKILNLEALDPQRPQHHIDYNDHPDVKHIGFFIEISIYA